MQSGPAPHASELLERVQVGGDTIPQALNQVARSSASASEIWRGCTRGIIVLHRLSLFLDALSLTCVSLSGARP
jgi:hypothetical protein